MHNFLGIANGCQVPLGVGRKVDRNWGISSVEQDVRRLWRSASKGEWRRKVHQAKVFAYLLVRRCMKPLLLRWHRRRSIGGQGAAVKDAGELHCAGSSPYLNATLSKSYLSDETVSYIGSNYTISRYPLMLRYQLLNVLHRPIDFATQSGRSQ